MFQLELADLGAPVLLRPLHRKHRIPTYLPSREAGFGAGLRVGRR